MTPKSDKPERSLETLYRKAGEVEPDAGLDRTIRARADQAVHQTRASRSRPWLGGLVTASVAVIAIAIVVRQAPSPEQPPPVEESAVEARSFMSPSATSRLEQKESTAADRSRVAPKAATGTPAPAAPEAARRERREAARTSAQPAADARSAVEPDRIGAVKQAGPEAMLERIRALIEDGRTERARALLDEFYKHHPDYAVPEDIREALAEPH